MPRTVSSRDPHGVVSVQGRCATNASPVATIVQHPQHRSNEKNLLGSEKLVRHQFPTISAPTAICKADGTWQILGATECVCDNGYTISPINGLCTGGNLKNFSLRIKNI